MSVGSSESRKSETKKWNVLTGNIALSTTWGINPGLLPQLLTRMKEDQVGTFNEGENNLSFANLKKLVAHLYSENIDTADLAAAVQAFLYRKKTTAPAADEPVTRKVYASIQAALYYFSRLVDSFVTADGIWGPASQALLQNVQQFYNLPPAPPSALLLQKLQLIISRLPVIEGTVDTAVSFIQRMKFTTAMSETKKAFQYSRSKDALQLNQWEGKGSLRKAGKELARFPMRTEEDAVRFDAFAACLLILQLGSKKQPDDVCDLLLLKDREQWQTLYDFPCKNKNDYYFSPAYGLSFADRTNVSFTLRYIARTDFALEVIAFFISGNLGISATMGYDVDDKEIGRERLFDAGPFFREYNTDPAVNEPAMLAGADYIKFFVVRKNRKPYVQQITYQPPGYPLPPEFYQLLTLNEEDILATACFGLNFHAPPEPKENFRDKVRNLYKAIPVLFEDDLQKGRWGEKRSSGNMYLEVSAHATLDAGWVAVNIGVREETPAADSQPSRKAAILLPESFQKPIHFIAFKDGLASLSINTCSAFTFGAYTDDGTMLEMDLDETKWSADAAPLYKVSEDFKDKTEALYHSTPVTVNEDPQKNRWGGNATTKYARMKATVAPSLIPDYFTVTLEVSSLTSRALKREVAIFLPGSFSHEIRYVPAVGKRASLTLTTLHAFTAGAYTHDGNLLELDLQQLKGLPRGFYDKGEKPA